MSATRRGDDTAFELLLRRYDYLVHMRARTFFLQGAEYEDLVQEGMIGLFKGCATTGRAPASSGRSRICASPGRSSRRSRRPRG
ncbi:MAG: hypothetical protein K6W08_04460 [Firmicutes bacterium]|nr:hypothetical protein [Bacillota bacterium]